MFQDLTRRLDQTFKKLAGQDRLTAENVTEALREVRLALLEADVHYGVAKGLVARIREQALGQEVLGSLTPAQQVVKVVNAELVALLREYHVRMLVHDPLAVEALTNIVNELCDLWPCIDSTPDSANRFAPGRQRIYCRYVKVSVESQRQRSGNRRCGHDQQVGIVSLCKQFAPLLDAKTVLLIDNDHPQPGK